MAMLRKAPNQRLYLICESAQLLARDFRKNRKVIKTFLRLRTCRNDRHFRQKVISASIPSIMFADSINGCASAIDLLEASTRGTAVVQMRIAKRLRIHDHRFKQDSRALITPKNETTNIFTTRNRARDSRMWLHDSLFFPIVYVLAKFRDTQKSISSFMRQIARNKNTALPWRFIQILDHSREEFALSALRISDRTRILQHLLCHRISKLSEKELASEIASAKEYMLK